MILGDWNILLADLEDWLQLLVPAVFVIIWVISQIAGAGGKKPARPGRRAGRPQQPQQPGGLANEIESFLRKVKNEGRPPGQQRQPQQQQPRPAARPEPEPAVARQMLTDDEVVEAEVIEPAPQPARRRKTEKRRRRKLAQSSAQLDDRSLSSEVDMADEKMLEHVHEVFEHKLGSLSDTSDAIHEKDAATGAGMPDVPTTADAVQDMLANPTSVRQAIILSEILSRPGQRP